MEINIHDIPDEGLEISASEKDIWFAGVLAEVVGDDLKSSARGKLDVSASVTEGNINIDGSVTLSIHPTCDRCLEGFDRELSIKFHQVLAPLYQNERQQKLLKQEDVELVTEDLDFAYYEGDSFDLGDVVREQLVMAMPMKYLCRDDCKGLCQRCGKDLNGGSCDCAASEIDPRWEALKGFKGSGQ
jgi:DUF177 domain-containing protein